MRSLKEFKPLWSFIKEDKTKIIIAGIIIFITEVVNTLGGYLNGQAVESITKLELKRALCFQLLLDYDLLFEFSKMFFNRMLS